MGKRGSSELLSGPNKQRKISNKYSSKSSRRTVSLEDATTPERCQARQGQQQRQRVTGIRTTQAVAMPTPFLRRIRNHQLSSPVATAGSSETVPVAEPVSKAPPPQGKGRRRSGSRPRLSFERELLGLRAAMDPERFGHYEATLRALDAILKATCPRKTPVAAPSSLLAMCLRQIPEYVGELEVWEQKEARANGIKSALQESRVPLEVYSELESLGTVEGWKQLCVVVRAHGVRIVREAVQEDLIEDEMAELLIRLCLEYMPPTQVSSLVDTFLRRHYRSPSGSGESLFSPDPALQPLRILQAYDVSDSHLLLEKLTNLLAGGFLPASWVLTEHLNSLWASAARKIARKSSPFQEVAAFVSTSIKLLCRLISARRAGGLSEEETKEKQRAQKILTEGIAVLASMPLLGREGAKAADPTASPNRKTALHSRRVQYILLTSLNEIQDAKKRTQKDLGVYLLHLCLFLSCDAAKSAGSAVERAWQSAQDCDDTGGLSAQYDATLALVGTIAHLCSRGTHLPRNDHLSLLCDKLETLHLPVSSLRNLRVDGAFFLAEHTGDLRDLAFAESLKAKAWAGNGQDRAQDQNLKSYDEHQKPSHAGFRWDEDIGEWVVVNKTPVIGEAPTARRSTRASVCTRSAIDFSVPESRTLPPRSQSGRNTALSDYDGDSSTAVSGDSESDDASEDSDDDGYDEEETNQSPDTSDIEMSIVDCFDSPGSPAFQGGAGATAKARKRAESPEAPTPTSPLPPPRRRSCMGFGPRRKTSRPAPELAEDELAPGGTVSDSWKHSSTRPARTRKGARSGSHGTLLSLHPVRKPGMVARDYYALDSHANGSSDDELSFV